MNKIAAIVLAAGKGKRMGSKNVNKAVVPLANKSMILHTIELLEDIKIAPIIVVVGFAKNSVIDAVGSRVIFAEQKKRMGTAHAVLCSLKELDHKVNDVLILNGDDSAFYTKDTILKLIKAHLIKNSSFTFLTIELSNPEGLGRIVRDSNGNLIAIIEDKDANPTYKLTNEVNPACYVFNLDFLKRYLPKIEKSKVTGEYYLTRLVDIAIKNNERVETIKAGKIPWRGINTIEELKEAERLFLQAK